MKKYQNKKNNKVAILKQKDDRLQKAVLQYENNLISTVSYEKLEKEWVEIKAKKSDKEKVVKTPKKTEKVKSKKSKKETKTTQKSTKTKKRKAGKRVSKEKLKYEELVEKFNEFNKEHNNDPEYFMTGVVVICPENFKNELSVEERSFRIQSNAPAFLGTGKDIVAVQLVDEEVAIRLDAILDETGFEYCYVEK